MGKNWKLCYFPSGNEFPMCGRFQVAHIFLEFFDKNTFLSVLPYKKSLNNCKNIADCYGIIIAIIVSHNNSSLFGPFNNSGSFNASDDDNSFGSYGDSGLFSPYDESSISIDLELF
ncbi:11011_t:CDS:2, partial [Funneliformis geosporum]